MKKIIIISILFLIGFVAGTIGLELKFLIPIIIVGMMLFYSYYLNVMIFTKNVNLVDRYIQTKTNHPYFAILKAATKKDFQTAEHYLSKLSPLYNQTKLAVQASMYIETHQFSGAEAVIKRMKVKEAQYHHLAILSLLKNDFDQFNKYKSVIKNKTLLYSLEAEQAYRNGNIVQAESAGKQAIESTSGIQRWVLVKTLQFQQENAQRQTYF